MEAHHQNQWKAKVVAGSLALERNGSSPQHSQAKFNSHHTFVLLRFYPSVRKNSKSESFSFSQTHIWSCLLNQVNLKLYGTTELNRRKLKMLNIYFRNVDKNYMTIFNIVHFLMDNIQQGMLFKMYRINGNLHCRGRKALCLWYTNKLLKLLNKHLYEKKDRK